MSMLLYVVLVHLFYLLISTPQHTSIHFPVGEHLICFQMFPFQRMLQYLGILLLGIYLRISLLQIPRVGIVSHLWHFQFFLTESLGILLHILNNNCIISNNLSYINCLSFTHCSLASTESMLLFQV